MNDEERHKKFEEFVEWQKQTQNAMHTVQKAKSQLDNSAPITVPRGWLIAGSVALVAMIVATFPILLFGVALGALATVWLSNAVKIK